MRKYQRRYQDVFAYVLLPTYNAHSFYVFYVNARKNLVASRRVIILVFRRSLTTLKDAHTYIHYFAYVARNGRKETIQYVFIDP